MHRAMVLLISAAAMIGCSASRIVQVIDPAGVPVMGAEVEAVSLSMNSAPNVTDAKGEAMLPGNPAPFQETKWVDVSKPGYRSVQIPIPANWPLRVTLAPEDKP